MLLRFMSKKFALVPNISNVEPPKFFLRNSVVFVP
jgi:hypothetical protein